VHTTLVISANAGKHAVVMEELDPGIRWDDDLSYWAARD
jgi:hypothetical protein